MWQLLSGGGIAPGDVRDRLHAAWLFRENHAQQRAMDFKMAVVINETQMPKLVHEMTHARAGRTDHLSKRLLADFCVDRLRPTFLAKIGHQQQRSGEPFLG